MPLIGVVHWSDAVEVGMLPLANGLTHPSVAFATEGLYGTKFAPTDGQVLTSAGVYNDGGMVAFRFHSAILYPFLRALLGRA